MGAVLGLSLAAVLMMSNERHIFNMLVQGADPGLAIAVFVGVFVLIPAIGASLSGLVFILMEDQ